MSEALARAACQQLRAAGHSAYVVGGFVRDRTLGRRPGDVDLATSAHPNQVLDVFPRSHATGVQHGTVTAVLDEGVVEITTYRAEGGYSDQRRPDEVQFLERVEDDLARRDFTVNAMAWDPLDDRLIDPFGGRSDLRAGVLRCVGDPGERFNEDALRLLRAVRFVATHALRPAEGVEAAMCGAAAAIEAIAAERIEAELSALLERADRPSEGLELARRCGLLEYILPEVLPMVGQAQNRFHAYDVWHHTMACVDAAPSGNVALRWAALLHDLGKPPSATEHPDRPGEFRFYGHERLSAEMGRAIAARLRMSNTRRARIGALIETHMHHPDETWGDAAVRRLLAKLEGDLFDDFLALKRADVQAKGTGDVPGILAGVDRFEERAHAERARGNAFSRKDLAVDGTDIAAYLGQAPGPWLGQVFAQLLDAVLEDPSLNERQKLLKLLSKP
jgi:tRNA nucleotidyltransferase (CCA-adding enzyme)